MHVCYEAHISYNFRESELYIVYEVHRYHVSHISLRSLKISINTYYIIYTNKLYKIDSVTSHGCHISDACSYEAHISYNFRGANYILYMRYIDTMYHIYHSNHSKLLSTHTI